MARKNKEKRFNTEDAETAEGTERKKADSRQLTVNRHSSGFFSHVFVQARGRVARALRREEGFLAPKKHSERKKRASLEMTV